MLIQKLNIVIICAYLISLLTVLAFLSWDFVQFIFSIPFFSFFIIVNLRMVLFRKSVISQIVLLITSLLFIVWNAYSIYSFHSSHDAQAGLIILFAAIYAFPIMLIGWVVAAITSPKAIDVQPKV